LIHERNIKKRGEKKVLFAWKTRKEQTFSEMKDVGEVRAICMCFLSPSFYHFFMLLFQLYLRRKMQIVDI
jgi:hypothetical protein